MELENSVFDYQERRLVLRALIRSKQSQSSRMQHQRAYDNLQDYALDMIQDSLEQEKPQAR